MQELCTNLGDGSACSAGGTASNRTSSGPRAGRGSTITLPQWLRDDVFVPRHHTCCSGAQTRIAKRVQTSLQPDIMQSKSSALLPPRAFVQHFQCNYMLNICLSICWIPSICMTRFNAGLAKPAGMTAMPSNHRPSAAGRVCPALRGAGEGEEGKYKCHQLAAMLGPLSRKEKMLPSSALLALHAKSGSKCPVVCVTLPLSSAQHLSRVVCRHPG